MTRFTKRRKQIWEALHPDSKRQRAADLPDDSNTPRAALLDDDIEKLGDSTCATQVETDSRGQRKSPQQTKGFAAATAAATGQSKATTNRALASVNALGIDTLTKVTNTSLDSGVELDALAKLPLSKIGH